MAFQTAMLPGEAFALIRSNVPSWKAQAQNALATIQAGNIDTNYVFAVLNQLSQITSALATWKAVTGLDTYATAQGYPNSLVTDCTSIQTASQACTSWVVTNFPASGGFLLDFSINADGSRTARSFTNVQTAGLATLVSALINTIS
jgi:hypothetical protein